MRAWALLGQHRFAAALDLATALNRRVPDDLMVYGLLTDANIELGRYYEAAEKSAQWMLDLRPGNIPALTRAAYLRELFGDVEGRHRPDALGGEPHAVPGNGRPRLGDDADRPPASSCAGSPRRRKRRSNRRWRSFPDYHYALGTLADVRTAQQRHREAGAAAAAALRRWRRIPRTCSSSPKRRRGPA